MQQQPLAGVTVLDFGQVYNGPYCGFLLAQAGARVIKVESLIGETLRARGRASAASYAFAMLNTNKESMTLNIKSAEGQGLLKRLVRNVDVVFENFAPGTMDRYGIGAEALRAENPRLIYASSTGYGTAKGPYREYLGMDITLQAMTGVMSITGEDGGPPLKTAAAFADFIAGTHLYGAIVSALYAREHSGEGATVDISMQDCVFPTLATALALTMSPANSRPGRGTDTRARRWHPITSTKLLTDTSPLSVFGKATGAKCARLWAKPAPRRNRVLRPCRLVLRILMRSMSWSMPGPGGEPARKSHASCSSTV